MRLVKFNLLNMRHGPKPKPDRVRKISSKAGPSKAPLRTIIVEAVAETEQGVVKGLGEVRASAERFGESARDAWTLAPMLANKLLGVELDADARGEPLAAAVSSVVNERLRSLLNLSHAPLGGSHRATRFAFETALLDATARGSGLSMRRVLGGDDGPVGLTVRNYKVERAEDLLAELIGNPRRDGWIRLASRPDVNGDLAALNMASTGLPPDGADAGVWLNAQGAWSSLRMERFLASVRQLPQFRAGLPLIIEEPFSHDAYEELSYFVDLFESFRASGELNARILLSTWLTSPANVRLYSALAPRVDLGLSPQRVGGVQSVLSVVAEARACGFRGRVYFENVGANTDINTSMLATLSAVTPEAVLHSASPAGSSRWPIVEPRPLIAADGAVLILPEGPGLGLRLNPDSLRHRLDEVQVASEEGLESGLGARERYLSENATPDSIEGENAAVDPASVSLVESGEPPTSEAGRGVDDDDEGSGLDEDDG